MFNKLNLFIFWTYFLNVNQRTHSAAMKHLLLQFEIYLLHHIAKENPAQSTLTHKYVTA